MNMQALHVDLESRSACDLRKSGAYRYFEHPSTSIICGSYRFGDGPVRRWRGNTPPAEVLDHIRNNGPMIGHNQSFERLGFNAMQVAVSPENQNCTLARAQALALPASLDQLGEALKAPVQKDKDGHRLMMTMCKPRTLEPLTWKEDEASIERLQQYCDQDVLTECAIDKILPQLSESEQRLWVLDQTINDRGVALNVPVVRRALDAVEEAKRRADARMWRLTDGAVRKCTEAAKIVAWVRSRGIPCTSVAQDETEDLILCAEMFDDPLVEQVLRLRETSAKTFKFKAMLDTVCADGRIRGMLAYHGTMGGRWAGRLVQPHNLKRISEEEAPMAQRTLALLSGPSTTEALVEALDMFDAPLEALSICARPMLVAGPGKTLMGGDFSNIEGRVNAWLAGAEWKLDAFRAFDAGKGPDLYRVTAGSILDKDTAAVTSSDRQLWGKVPELACGYQGGVGAFHKMGANYGVRIEDKQALRIVRGWREANPEIVAMWAELQQAAIDAVERPGLVVSALGGRIAYVSRNGFLFCRVPSGRVISYPSPSVERKEKTVVIDGDEVTFTNWGVSFWGVKKGWRKLDLYGGMQCAHVVSGTARDILVGSMFRLEAAGYPIVLTVHDENLCEVDPGFGSLDEMKSLMAAGETWTKGLPIAVSAWEGPIYAH
jgi:DNA polymerase